jgi:hypothetical protein
VPQKSSSLSAPRARQSAAGKKKRATSFGMTRIYELASGVEDRCGAIHKMRSSSESGELRGGADIWDFEDVLGIGAAG